MRINRKKDETEVRENVRAIISEEARLQVYFSLLDSFLGIFCVFQYRGCECAH